MKRIIALLCAFAAPTALAEPRVTVLIPVPGALSPQVLTRTLPPSVRTDFVSSPVVDVANSLHSAHAAILVVDTTYGPLPANREHVLAARQAWVPEVLVLMTNVDALYEELGDREGDELLELIESEVRNTLELYEIGGIQSAVYHDSSRLERSTSSMKGGLDQLASHLGALPAAERRRESLMPTNTATGDLYLLTNPEADGRGVTIDGTRDLTLWIAGTAAAAAIAVDGVARPGDVVPFLYRTAVPIPAAPGERLILIEGDHIVGVGVVAEIGGR